eukprot:762513-Hanusia_phi.AAC.2
MRQLSRALRNCDGGQEGGGRGRGAGRERHRETDIVKTRSNERGRDRETDNEMPSWLCASKQTNNPVRVGAFETPT